MPLNDLETLVTAIVPLQDRALSRLPTPAADERLGALQAARRERARTARRRGRAASWAVAAAGAVALALGLRPGPLAFEVGAAHVRGVLGARVEATEAQPVGLYFSDGTELELGRGARGRVLSLDAKGAQLVVERGTLRAAVVHRPASTWLLAVGPFDVQVTGTRFDVSWDPRRESFALAMHEGSVTVTGRCLAEPLTARAGDRVALPCPSARANETASAPWPEPDVAALARDLAGAPAVAPPAPRPPPVAVARRAPTVRTAAEELASEEELLRLGDAARAAGRRTAAQQLYETLRRRFPGGEGAATAAFHLGQVAFDQGGSLAEARRAFTTYLSERPDGPLAREALGRLLETEHRAGTPAAETLARQYLERFPRGPHAALARAIVSP